MKPVRFSRGSRLVAICACLTIGASAQATIIKFEMTGTLGAGQVPGVDLDDLIKLSFSLNTAQADASFVLRDRGLGAGVQLTNFIFRFALMDLFLGTDEKTLVNLPGLTPGGVFGGQTLGPGATTYDGTINFSDNAGNGFVRDTAANLSVITAQQFFASTDPFADLLLSLDGMFCCGYNSFSSEWGGSALDMKLLSVRVVPEPATAWLAIIGLIAMLGLRRPRVATNPLAGSRSLGPTT